MHQQPSPLRYARTSLVAIVAALVLIASLLPSAVVAAAQDPAITAKLAQAHVPGRVIVTYKKSASVSKKSAAVRGVKSKSVRRLSPKASGSVVVELAPGQSMAAALEEIGSQPGVALVRPDYLIRVAADSNDPYYTNGSLWGMHGDSTSPPQTYGSGAGEAWAAGHTGSSDVVIGIIDQGIQVDHPDLAANIWTNPGEIPGNLIDDDGNGYVDDVNGYDFYNDDGIVFDSASTDSHGSHVAGTVGAKGGNGTGVAGVDWNVTLISAKFIHGQFGSYSDAVRAIDYVTDLKSRYGLDIVATNNSWTGPVDDPDLVDAIERAGDAGILFVAAAGNSGNDISDGADPEYPAASECDRTAAGGARGWDCIISVANMTSGGELATAANAGTDSNYSATNVDLAAPGSGIVSTTPTDTYGWMSGTSMAAPHVAGAIALCKTVGPTLTASEIRSHVMSSVASNSDLTSTTVTGGHLDIPALLALCGGPIPTPDIVGETQADANTTITDLGLTVGTVTSVYHDTVAAGDVISQSPRPGTGLDADDRVNYVLSLGRPTVPNLVGLTSTAAESALNDAMLVGSPSSEYHATVPLDEVISQGTPAGSTVDTSTPISYVVSLGPIDAPNIVGLSSTAADAVITGAGLTVGSVLTEYSDTIDLDDVISQVPVAGTHLGPDDPVGYTKSLGQPIVPNLVGLTDTAAEAALSSMTLVGSASTVYHATVPLDEVISQGTPTGTTVPTGATVSYVVSLGPTVMPNLSGMNATQADAAIGTADLIVDEVTSAYDDDVASGLVFDQDPAAGTPLGSGDLVDYVLSLGRPEVPDITGMTAALADAALADVTLHPGNATSAYDDDTAEDLVVSSLPIAGTPVGVGSEVDYVLSLGRPEVPDITGLTAAARRRGPRRRHAPPGQRHERLQRLRGQGPRHQLYTGRRHRGPDRQQRRLHPEPGQAEGARHHRHDRDGRHRRARRRHPHTRLRHERGQHVRSSGFGDQPGHARRHRGEHRHTGRLRPERRSDRDPGHRG